MSFRKYLVMLAVALMSSSALAEVVVIVSAENANAQISKAHLSRIFMGKANEFESGGKAVAVNQISASASRAAFDSDVLGKTTAQINAYWSKQMFSGGGTPPSELNGDLAVIQHVASSPDAIGYVDSTAVNGSVKVLSIQ